MDLMAADALLAGRQQVRDLKPLVNRNMAAFQNGPDLGRKLPLALQTSLQARPGRLAADSRNPLDSAAMRADGTARPDDAFQLRNGGVFIVEVRGGQDAHCGLSP